MDRPAADELQSHNQAAVLRFDTKVDDPLFNRVQEGLVGFKIADVYLSRFPADEIDGVEHEVDPAGIVHIHQIDSASATLVRGPALGVARIDDGRVRMAQDLAGMYVSQRPIVYAYPFQLLNRARRIGIVVGIVADVGVHQPDGKRPGRNLGKSRNQALSDLTPGIADAIHDSSIGLVGENWSALHRRSEPMASGRQRDSGLPPIQRIVVPMAYERAYARLVKPSQALCELDLRLQATVGAVEYVPGNKESIDSLFQAQADYAVVGIKRG